MFEQSLERVRVWYGLFVAGYVIMPEHVHLLLSEPERSTLAVALQMLKQITAQKLRPTPSRTAGDKAGAPEHFWQARYYDFNVRTAKKRIEKLRYIHRNPVKRDLVEKPEDWEWSSFRHYATGEEGAVEIEVGVDGKKARADGDAAAVEIGRDVRHLWRRDGKTPPKQPRLGRGALTMVGCATHPPQKKTA